MPDSIVHGSLTLFGAGLFTRSLGFVYRIYLSRSIGSQGMGILSMIGPILGFAVTIAMAGLPVAIAKVVAEQAQLNPRAVRTVLRVSLATVGILGATMLVAVAVLVPTLSGSVLPDPRTRIPLYAMSPLLVIIPFSAVLRGYFQGLRQMAVPAIAQVLEQVVRTGAVIFLVSITLPHGLVEGVVGAAVGSVIGEASGLAILIVEYLRRPRMDRDLPDGPPPPSARTLLWEMLVIAVPVTITRLVAAATEVADATMIPRRLRVAGFSQAAATGFLGNLTGMAIPLLFFPTVITLALAENLIPAVSQAAALGDLDRVRHRARKALQVAFLVSLPTSAVFLIFGRTLAALFYQRPEVGDLIVPLAFTGPFLYLEMTLTAILRGLGHATIPTVNGLVGAAVRLTVIYFLAAVPTIGIRAVIWGVAADLALSFLLNYMALTHYLPIRFDLSNWILKPMAAAVLMTLALDVGGRSFLAWGLGPWVAMLVTLAGGSLVYLAALFLTGSITGKQALL